MGDESTIRDAAEVVKGVVEAVPIYQDLAQPAVREVGTALATVAKTLHIVLSPLSALVWGYERVSTYVSAALEERLKGVPAERLQTPSPAIAGPALEALRFAEPSLRELYANLLAAAIDKTTAHNAHPAFVEILKQLSPDEAKLFAVLAHRRVDATIELWMDDTNTTGGLLYLRHFTTAVFDAGCEVPEHGDIYIDNLARLGLVEPRDDRALTDSARYTPLEEHPLVTSAMGRITQQDKRPRVQRSVLSVTSLGEQFAKACIRSTTGLDKP